eukprot:1161687-Pelagomonas_calceolata.AAC.14
MASSLLPGGLLAVAHARSWSALELLACCQLAPHCSTLPHKVTAPASFALQPTFATTIHTPAPTRKYLYLSTPETCKSLQSGMQLQGSF